MRQLPLRLFLTSFAAVQNKVTSICRIKYVVTLYTLLVVRCHGNVSSLVLYAILFILTLLESAGPKKSFARPGYCLTTTAFAAAPAAALGELVSFPTLGSHPPGLEDIVFICERGARKYSRSSCC